MASSEMGSYEERECVACLGDLVYDGQAGAWVECGACSGSGRCRVFVYAKAAGSANRLRECAGCGERFAGRDLVEVGPERAEWSLTVSEGDELCGRCAVGHGVL